MTISFLSRENSSETILGRCTLCQKSIVALVTATTMARAISVRLTRLWLPTIAWAIRCPKAWTPCSLHSSRLAPLRHAWKHAVRPLFLRVGKHRPTESTRLTRCLSRKTTTNYARHKPAAQMRRVCFIIAGIAFREAKLLQTTRQGSVSFVAGPWSLVPRFQYLPGAKSWEPGALSE